MLGSGVGGPPVAAAYLAFRRYWAGVRLSRLGRPSPWLASLDLRGRRWNRVVRVGHAHVLGSPLPAWALRMDRLEKQARCQRERRLLR